MTPEIAPDAPRLGIRLLGPFKFMATWHSEAMIPVSR